eukprot:CAMPEP_0172719184 /NCGR_PEP_ID=MMETSP1074-20121228/75357_1 /TAXON_ID=2916 /ORGANISM="Ceratium fusus, Strain PA161109" /LENGTH=476 /DNA_ID=CAMNT_0013544509 /DNA_START=375 /DNA_END=1805 /DNA_ORIENTATION=+
MTDHVFDCKADLTDRFRNANRDGGTMLDVCSATYAWFEKRYGDFCPSQCAKLQCRPTCAWLEEKKRQDKIGKMLADEKRRASALARGSADLDFELRKKILQAKDQISKNKTAAAHVQRAAAVVKEKKALLEQTLVEESKALKDLSAWHNRLQKLRKKQDSAKEALDEARRLDDMAGMQERLQGKAKERINKKIADQGAELKKTKSAVDPLSKKLKLQEKEYKSMWEPTVKKARAAMEKAKKAADERTRERKAAEAKLKAIGPSPILEDLVKQLRSMEQQARDFLSKKNKAYMFLKMSADAAKKEIGEKKLEIDKLNTKAAAAAKTLAELQEELKKEEKKHLKKAETADRLTKAKVAYELSAKKAGEQEHILSYFRKNLDEHKEASSKARKAVTIAEKGVKLENFGFDKQIRDAAKAVHAEQKLQKQANDAKAELAKESKSLDDKLAVYNKTMKDLEARKPDIVKMHGLGLISKLGY